MYKLLLALGAIAVMTNAETSPIATTKPTLDVGIIVSDIDKAKAFYGGVLGLAETAPLPMPDGSSMTRYVSGTAIIKLRAVPQAARHPTAIREAVGFRLLTIYVTDFESVLGRWKATGAAEPRPIPAPKGAQAALLADPDGNPIELVGMPDDNMAGLDKMAIGLTVSNVEKSREFYGKVLGLQESRPATPASPNGATEYRFMAGKTQIAFWPGLSANLPAHTGNITEALGFRYFTFMVKDLDATAAALKARGAKIVMEPRDFGAIARIMMVSDPDGNWIEFAALKSGR